MKRRHRPHRRYPAGARAPVALVVPALIAVAFLLLPLLGILVRTEWGDVGTHLSSPGVTEALRLSLLVSFSALGLSLLLGVPLAWLLARVRFPGKAFVRSLVMLPMVLPPTVGGVALLLGLGRRGLIGPWLEDTFGIVLPFHTSGAVVAATFVAMPFLVISLEGALRGLRPRYEETAASLGASPVRVFLTVTLPMVAPGLIAGAALTWARALGEFGATITFAGNLPGATQTLPLQVYLLLQDQPEAATSLSLLLLAIATAVLVALRGRWTGGATADRTDRARSVRQDAPEAHDAPEPPAPEPLAADPLAPEPPAPGAPASGSPESGAAESGGPEPAPPEPAPAEPASPEPGTPTAAHGGAVHQGPERNGPAHQESAHGEPEPWSLRAEVTGFTRLALDAGPGTTIAVVGPNGAGKTTLLRALLGLTPRAHAELRLGDTEVTALPPHRRGVAWVPQDGALFPHLSALSNTAYGLRAHGVPRAEARRSAQAWLDRLGVGQLARRRPAQLSGGQAQRVALARALAARPRLLLLDEPLAALDQTTRARVRHTLRTHLEGFGGVCLIVTHDPVEAVSLADRVLVLDEGRAVQYAPPTEVTRHPRSPWVARMLGRNAWPGTATPGGLALPGGGRLVVAEPLPAGTDALAIIAPEAVSVHRERPGGSPRNVWPGTVREITASGSRLRVLITSPQAPDLVAEITPQAAAELGLADGTAVWTSVKATEAVVVAL
ncbi:ABC transporter permease [Streptomyces sp. NPDC055078]